MDALHWWRQGDAVTQGTAVLLLAMSVASWVVIVWKLRLMHRANADVARCTAGRVLASAVPRPRGAAFEVL
jgi:biopolymer transport protein ExbB